MKNNRKVVITGIGPITSNSNGRDEFWKKIMNNEVQVKKIPAKFENNYKYKTRYYVPFPEISLEEYGSLKKYTRLMEETSKLAVIGTELALIDSKIKKDKNSPVHSKIFENGGIILGNAICSLNTGFNFYTFHTYGEILKNMPENVIKPKYNRMVIPATMPDSAAAWISILHGITGYNYTINASCASGTYAVGEAYRKIKDGYSDIVISGGVECLKDDSGAIMRGFDCLGTLTRSEDGKPNPFSKQRSGFLFSEGAGCIIILEELESAKKRGANIYAEIVDYQSNSDAFNIIQVQNSGEQITKLLKKIIGNYKIDYINTHGTGTYLNDLVEGKIIKEIFGEEENQPVINSTKSMLGHSIGASGALEIAVTALSIKNSRVHANISDNTFEGLNLARSNTDLEINYALSTSYGFGGHNAAVLLKKYNEN